jgi:FAD-dependent urate hydroxylase
MNLHDLPQPSVEGLAELEARIRRDLRLIEYPTPRWVPPRRTAAGEPVLDVLVVGAGQGGLAIGHMLQRERIDNFAIIDRAPRDREGPWKTYARMRTLRSWKTVTGPDLDIPSLTFQSWFEAQYGAAEFERLNKIPKEMWQDYLLWMRDLLALPVRNGVALDRIEPVADGLLAAHVIVAGKPARWLARKIVLAMGIEASGYWWMPEHVAALPTRFRAHTADAIDFAALAGKRVAVLGAGASAFDNAATALEHGAASVTLCCRRAELQRVQPYKAISYPGFLRYFGELDDATRWTFMHYLLDIREALPVETWNRVTRHANFALRTGSPWDAVRVVGDAVAIATPQGELEADFLICGTGFRIDLARRPELRGFTDRIATWADRYTPPEGERNERLAPFPYLGPEHQLTERAPGTAPFLRDIYLFDFGATMSCGPSGASINAMKYAVPRLVGSISRDLFHADIDHHWRTLRAFQEPEFPLTFARDAAGGA